MILFALACSTVEEDKTPVWYGEVEPIITQNCASCHQEGGTSPFVLTSYEDVKPLASIVWNSVSSGSMPPWLPEDDCRPLKDTRSLTDREKETIRLWVEGGTLQGDPALGISEIPLPKTFEPTHSTQVPLGFVPSTDQSDQYRCFISDLTFEQDQYLTASNVIPGSEQVHHVLIYAIGGQHRELVEAADELSSELGYSCFGSPYPDGSGVSWLEGFPAQIGAWVPALNATIYPEGTAFRIPKDSIVIIQVHYSALGGDAKEDKTIYEMILTEEEPEKLLVTKPLAIQDLSIPPGADSVEFSDTFTNYSSEPVELAAVAAHMHMIGKEQRTTLIHEDGEEECVLDIRDWDFNWQQSYRFANDETVMIDPGAQLELSCTYDNSAENQPIVDGEQQDPKLVQWGDGTLDEMCLMYMTLVEPFKPSPPEESLACYGYEECVDSCGNTPECLMSCEDVEIGCFECTLSAAFDCATPCALAFLPAQECLIDCFTNNLLLEGTIGTCMEDRCPQEYETMMSCVGEEMVSEECSEGLMQCGVTF